MVVLSTQNGVLAGSAGLVAADAAATRKPVAKEQAKSTPAKDGKSSTAKKADGDPASKKAGAAPPKPEASKPSEPSTYKVKKRLFKVEVTLDGVFEAKNSAEVVLRPREWSDLEVLRAVEHGTAVKQGELLASLETEKIDKVIADLERDLVQARLTLKDAEVALQLARANGPLELAAAERSKRNIDQDLANFVKTDRPMMERTVNFMVKMSEDMLAYEQEELRQLEKMYKADDLTEETEEIILRRTRDSVERAKFNLDRMKVERDEILKQTLPRAAEMVNLSAQRQAIEYQRSKVVLPLGARRLELSLERLKQEAARGKLRLNRLQEDRAAMTIKSPVDGNVYYGRCVRGKWVGGEMAGEKLRRGGRLTNNDVFMTVAEPRPLAVRVSVPEKQLRHVKAGLKGFVQPNISPDLKLTAIVERVSPVPSSSREFDTVLTVAMDDSAKALMPGMSCEARFVPFYKAETLAVPLAAVGSDELDPRKQYVALPGKDGKPEKKPVTLGERADKYVEVLKGLTEGTEILAEYPKDSSESGSAKGAAKSSSSSGSAAGAKSSAPAGKDVKKK